MKSKRFKGLDCSAPAGEMIQLALRAQLKAMCALRRQALDWNDPEGVHKMRVLSRRLRSALSDFEPHLRKHTLPIRKLRAIAKSLGAVRDEDVAIAALTELKSDAHGRVVEGIELLIDERRERREEARAELKKALRRSVIKEFSDEFENKVQNLSVPQKKSATPIPVPAYAAIGAKVITERLREFRKASPQIFSPFSVKDLHELRILAKRLRYSVELFQPCREHEMKAMAKEIALLQTSLGELHDCDMWIEDLGARLKKLSRTSQSDSDIARTDSACTWLMTHLAKERTQHYRDALQRWKQWESDEFLNRVMAQAAELPAKT